MKIYGWTVDVEYLIGRRFRWTNDIAPDITFVSYKKVGRQGLLSTHAKDGSCQWLPMTQVCEAIKAGILVEADGVPFTNARTS